MGSMANTLFREHQYYNDLSMIEDGANFQPLISDTAAFCESAECIRMFRYLSDMATILTIRSEARSSERKCEISTAMDLEKKYIESYVLASDWLEDRVVSSCQFHNPSADPIAVQVRNILLGAIFPHSHCQRK